jgi:hypothetical protein
VCCAPPPKRPCWIKRAFQNVGLWFSVSGNIGSTGTYNGGEYWVRNDANYYATYCGDNRVFAYGVPSYSSSYTYVDNYRSGPFPPVRFIPDVPRGQPIPQCRPGPPPPHQGGGGGGGRPHR